MTGSLKEWREYFSTASSDIFGIIERAIMVAASDCPRELRLKRDRIAERLFSYRLKRYSGCDRVGLGHEGDSDGDDDCEGDDAVVLGSKQSNNNNTNDTNKNIINNNKNNNNNKLKNIENDKLISGYSYREAEALTDEIEEETQVFGEVLRIKELLLNNHNESDSVLFESLRRLQLMALTVDILKGTEIGKVVNGLQKQGSTRISNLARSLIDEWKVLVDEWYSATQAITMKSEENSPDSMNPSAIVDEEEGLPSPPLDEGAFFATQPNSMELSDFFDGVDDDENPQGAGEFITRTENRRKPSPENQNIIKRRQQNRNEANVLAKDNKSGHIKKQEAVMKPSTTSNANSGPGRPLKHNVDQKMKNKSCTVSKNEKCTNQSKSMDSQQDKLKSSNEVDVNKKLEAAKRKLQERYQEAENAKRQRTIQVMELNDLPKQSLVRKNPHMKPGNRTRHWAQGRG